MALMNSIIEVAEFLQHLKLIISDQHEVFGGFTGCAILDDGTEIRVKDFPGFAEKVENKW